MTYLSFVGIFIEFSQQGTTLSQVTVYQRQLNISKRHLRRLLMSIGTRDENVKLLSFPQMILVQCFTKEGLETLDYLIELSP